MATQHEVSGQAALFCTVRMLLAATALYACTTVQDIFGATVPVRGIANATEPQIPRCQSCNIVAFDSSGVGCKFGDSDLKRRTSDLKLAMHM